MTTSPRSSRSTSRRRFSAADRRARLVARHHLAASTSAADVHQATRSLVGFHASDPVTVYLSAWARVRGFRRDDLDRALYDERSLLKILGMRRTMFVEPIDVATVVNSACTESIARGERQRLLRMLEGAVVAADPKRWLMDVEERTLEALDRLGEATASDLTAAVPELATQITFGAGTRWAGTVGVSTRLLFLLAAEGRIIRGRPRGGITSSLYRWAPLDRWIPGGLPAIPRHAAQAELVRRYLEAFGPATLDDVRWWTGWTMTDTRRAIGGAGVLEVDLEDGKVAFALGDDGLEDEPGARAGRGTRSAGASEPAVTLLPALDATIMGWTDRGWFLGDHRAALFDRSGNAGPTIWVDGGVVGGWGQRREGEVAWRLLEDLGTEIDALVEARAAELEAWLGPLRFIPRFRTPLERELTA